MIRLTTLTPGSNTLTAANAVRVLGVPFTLDLALQKHLGQSAQSDFSTVSTASRATLARP